MPIGEGSERAAVVVNGRRIEIYESYEARVSVLTQPSSFVLHLGSGESAADLMRLCPPRALFEFVVGDQVVFRGRLGGPRHADKPATDVTIRGRDFLADLHDKFAISDCSYPSITPAALVRAAMDQCGMKDIKLSAEHPRAKKPIGKVGSIKTGNKWYDFIKKQLDRIGLFLWCLPDGTVELAEPDSSATASFKIVRRKTGFNAFENNPLSGEYDNDLDKRYSEYIVAGRGGIPKEGTIKARAGWVDEEMQNLGYTKPFVITDKQAKSREEAEHLARRRAAEINRGAWKLTYTMSGHMSARADGSGTLIWEPNRTVDVKDDKIELYRTLYIEGCAYQGIKDSTTTVLNLMRPEHMIFATDFDHG